MHNSSHERRQQAGRTGKRRPAGSGEALHFGIVCCARWLHMWRHAHACQAHKALQRLSFERSKTGRAHDSQVKAVPRSGMARVRKRDSFPGWSLRDPLNRQKKQGTQSSGNVQSRSWRVQRAKAVAESVSAPERPSLYWSPISGHGLGPAMVASCTPEEF